MEASGQPRYLAWVRGNGIDRKTLNGEFGKFGKISKIFVNQEQTLGKVYFENNSDLRKACTSVQRPYWNIEYGRDDFARRKSSNNHTQEQNLNKDFRSIENLAPETSINGSSASIMDPVEEEFSVVYDFVDSIGRPVEVLENDEREFFVNLKDVRRNGFQIFRKTDYENAIITRIEDLREFEAFLLNQAYKYLLERKRTFNENEILSCMEKVKSRLWGKDSSRTFAPSNNNSLNVNITSKTTSTPAATPIKHQPSQQFNYASGSGASTAKVPRTNHGAGDGPNIRNGTSNEIRPPKQLADNYKPSFSHIKPVSKTNRGRNSFNSNRDRPSLRKPKTNGTKSDNEESWEADTGFGGPSSKIETKRDIKPVKPGPSDEVKDPNEMAKLSIDRITLSETGTPYKVLISYIQEKPGKNKVYYAQLTENMALVEELLVMVNDLASAQEDVTPIREGLYLVQFEGVWYRCLMIHSNYPEKCYVELFDYGNKEKLPGPFKEMPDSLKQIPAQSIRIKPDDSIKVKWKPDDEIQVVLKKKYDDGTHLVEPAPPGSSRPAKPITAEQSMPVETPKPKEQPKVAQETFFNFPPAFSKLKKGDEVKILSYSGEKFVLMSKECLTYRKTIAHYIQEMSHVPLEKGVEVNQIVLCSHEGRPNLHRATVTKIDGNVATLQYLDFAGEETQLSIKSLRNVDATLASKPRAVLETAVFPALKSLSANATKYLDDIMFKGTKLIVGDNEELIVDSKPLSEVIKALATPPVSVKVEVSKEAEPVIKVEPQPAPVVATVSDSKTEERIMFGDMPYYAVKPGVGCYFTFCCQDTQTITLISTSEESVNYMCQLEITPVDEKPYCPEEMEMCLVLYDESWNRAAVLGEENGKYSVLCVDFGNECMATAKEIRKIPKHIAAIPIIGLSAYFVDLPQDNPKVNAKLKELIPDQTQFDDVHILSVPDNESTVQYGIKVPSITQKLKEAGLL